MGVRYQLPGWPSAENGHTAALPRLTRAAGSGAVQYKDGVTGRPGTWRAPVEAPPEAAHSGTSAQATGGISYSRNSPGFYPNQYWARPEAAFWPGAGMPVAIYSDNLMPVPATDPRGVQSLLARALAQRGAGQVKSFAPLVMWPNVTGEGPG
jgi:hypothetical protein